MVSPRPRSSGADDARDRVLEGAPPEREVLVDNNKGVSPRLGQLALLAAATGDAEGIVRQHMHQKGHHLAGF